MNRSKTCFLAFLLLAGASSAAAQTSGPTLDRIRESGTFRIGFVPDAPPMSFLDDKGNAVGYSIDLCRHIAASVRNLLGMENIELTYVPLSAMEDRLSAVENADVDIECGASTVTLRRRERVDFTLLTFITGGAVASRVGKPIDSMERINGRTIAVTRGTTTESSLNEYVTSNEMDVEVRSISTNQRGIDALIDGDVDGYASDRAMLVGLAHHSKNPGEFRITSDIFSFEPYAMMVKRGDTSFRLAADRALAELYRTARIRRIYHNWFGRYGFTMSPVVEAMFEFQAVGE